MCEVCWTVIHLFVYCSIIGTLSHNIYNEVLKEISIFNNTAWGSNCGTSSLCKGGCGCNVLVSYIHMVGFCGQDCLCLITGSLTPRLDRGASGKIYFVLVVYRSLLTENVWKNRESLMGRNYIRKTMSHSDSWDDFTSEKPWVTHDANLSHLIFT